MNALFLKNGTLDIATAAFRLADSLPGWNGKTLRHNGVIVAADQQSARFAVEGGALEMKLSNYGERLDLDACFTGGKAPHWLHPLHGAEVSGAVRFFRTGLGFSGPTNLVPIGPEEGLFSYESHLVSAFVAADGSVLVIYTTDNRRFTPKTQIHNRIYRDEFRNRHVVASPVFLESGFATENIPVPAAGLVLPTLHLLFAHALDDGLARAARHIAEVNQARVPATTPAYYCSWYCKHDQFSAADLDRVLAGADQTAADFDSIQIDDGYCTGWGDWLHPGALWPDGMAAAANAITASGRRAGIWVAPMTAEHGGRIWHEHRDWLLHDLDGNPIVKMKAGAHEISSHGDRYALDLSHPEARAYIHHVFTTLRGWGYTLFKTDFMDWGYADSTTVRRHTPGKTSVMWADETLRLIRDAIGPESFWLGCIAPFAPFIGYCDAMRVASDVGTDWNEPGGTGNDGVGGGIMNMLQESYHCQFFNGVFWANDPDVIFLRDQDADLDATEVRSLALWSAMLGGTLTISDFFDELPPERLALWHFIHPHGRALDPARLPFWTDPQQRLYIAVRDFPAAGGHAVLVLNPLDTEEGATFAVRDLIGRESAVFMRWNPAEQEPSAAFSELSVKLLPHGHALYWIGDCPPPVSLACKIPV